MSEASDYVENQILNCYLNQTTITAPAAIFLSLHTSDPTDDDGGEVSGNGYARVAITDKFDAAAGTGGSLSSNADITGFTADGGAWTGVHWIGIHDAITDGNLLFHTQLTGDAVTVNDGDSFQVSSGNLTVTVA